MPDEVLGVDFPSESKTGSDSMEGSPVTNNNSNSDALEKE